MQAKNVFINRYAEVRVGWRLSIFVVMLLLLRWLIMSALGALGLRDDFIARALILGSTLAASFVMVRFVNRKPFGAIGLSLHPHVFREFGIGCLLGFLMMTGIFVVETLSGYMVLSWRGLAVFDVVKIVVWSMVYFTVAAFLEEGLFRGYFFQTLIQWITFLPATLLLSLLFAYGHLLNPNSTVFGLVNVGLASVWLSIAYLKTRSLWLPLGLHFAWNFSQTVLYGLPTSGITFDSLKLFDLTQSGPEWITGGAFGPEGGALATLALIACTWYVLKSPYLIAPEGIVTLDSVEDILPPPQAAERQTI